MNVSPIEFLWVMLNTVTLVFTITALFDARADREAVRILNGKARELAASGIVRREAVRVIVQVLLLSIAVPGLFSDRVTTLSPVVMTLMALPVLLLLASFWDSRERKRMTVLVAAGALVSKTDALDRIETKVEESIVVAREAAEASNHTKERFDAVYDRIEAGEVKAAAETERRDQVAETTAAEVHDLHTGDAPQGAA